MSRTRCTCGRQATDTSRPRQGRGTRADAWSRAAGALTGWRLLLRVGVVPAGVEPVHQPLSGTDRRSSHAADRADQRVGRAVPGVLVRLGRRLELLADRGVPVVVAARIVAGQDVAVLALGGPAVDFGEPDHGERVRGANELEQLDQALAEVGHGVVFT